MVHEFINVMIMNLNKLELLVYNFLIH